MTLNPYHEDNDHQAMVDDDRFILGSFNHWYFGHDDTGQYLLGSPSDSNQVT